MAMINAAAYLVRYFIEDQEVNLAIHRVTTGPIWITAGASGLVAGGTVALVAAVVALVFGMGTAAASIAGIAAVVVVISAGTGIYGAVSCGKGGYTLYQEVMRLFIQFTNLF